MEYKKVVGISDMAVSDNTDEIIVTYSLGSCLGVTVYDPVSGVGGMIHCMLPLSSIDTEKAKKCPAMFVDTGVPSLLNKFFACGGNKESMIVKAAGCSKILDQNGLFKIGERNFTLFRKILWKNEILLAAHDIGGAVSRTLSLEIGSGRTMIKSMGKENEL